LGQICRGNRDIFNDHLLLVEMGENELGFRVIAHKDFVLRKQDLRNYKQLIVGSAFKAIDE
jgi:hypothetical protein